MKAAERLLNLASKLERLEVVAGVPLPGPVFDRNPSWLEWSDNDVQAPDSFRAFLRDFGAVDAIEIAGGVCFLAPAFVREHLRQDYGDLLSEVAGVSCFPFATNGAGEYLLLATDDSGVWKFNAHMHPVSKPSRLADSFDEFLTCLVRDWEDVLEGRGGPYSTS